MSRRQATIEMMQWGYVALVSLAVAFTTMTGAAANTRATNWAPPPTPLGHQVCTVNQIPSTRGDRQACEWSQPSAYPDALGSAFFSPGTGGSEPSEPAANRYGTK